MVTGKIKPNLLSRKAKRKKVKSSEGNNKKQKYKSDTQIKSDNPTTALVKWEKRYSNTIIQKHFVPPMKQLRILLTCEPENIFYKDILWSSKKSPLTPKQLNLIVGDFKKKILQLKNGTIEKWLRDEN